MKKDILVSIFIPVFNGEKYLEQTLFSIKNQTYKNIEILLVDDSSTDNSLNIINKFVYQDSRFIVYQKTNGGMTAPSWNFILPKIKGDFVFYSSQDDFFSDDIIEKMVKKQKETDADTIIPEMVFYFSGDSNSLKKVGLNGNQDIELNGKEACVESLNWNIHGFTLSSKKLYENEIFPEDSFDSDEFITRKILFKSNKVVFSGGIFFYRQDNQNAITKNFTKKNFYTLNTQKRLLDFLQENKFDEKILINAKFDLCRKVIRYKALSECFYFSFKKDHEEIKKYLDNFKNQNCSCNSLFSFVKFPKCRLSLKFGILYLIYLIPFFYKVAIRIDIMRIKGIQNFANVNFHAMNKYSIDLNS